MPKITFMGAGSTVFARNVLGDCMCTEALRDSELALYDIDPVRLAESRDILTAMNETKGGHARISAYLGAENRKEALRGADFVVNPRFEGKPTKKASAIIAFGEGGEVKIIRE